MQAPSNELLYQIMMTTNLLEWLYLQTLKKCIGTVFFGTGPFQWTFYIQLWHATIFQSGYINVSAFTEKYKVSILILAPSNALFITTYDTP